MIQEEKKKHKFFFEVNETRKVFFVTPFHSLPPSPNISNKKKKGRRKKTLEKFSLILCKELNKGKMEVRLSVR